MARAPKSVSVLNSEKKSHRTKAELAARQQGEQSLATGTMFIERPEVMKNPISHAEFVRLDGLLSKIGKNDAIYETVINRYCVMLAECLEFEEKREQIFTTAEKLNQKLNALGDAAGLDELHKVTTGLVGLYKTMIEIDRQIESKRKMLLCIEKENIMTVSAALRSVPRSPKKKENPLLKALSGDDE